MNGVVSSLGEDGVFLMGIPNITAAAYASSASKEGHINLKSHEDLRKLMGKFFRNVFVFSMNDEVVHTGFGPMAHYLIAMGVGPRRD